MIIGCLLLSSPAFAQESLVTDTPEVGKHVMANMDAGSMILSLLMVLALIIVSALVLKRFNIVQQGGSQLKVIASLSLGAKERVIVVQAGEKQLLLGVTAHNITVLDTLTEPLVESNVATKNISSGLFSILNQQNKKANSK
jgi:flagellar protein FliO/FliZ